MSDNMKFWNNQAEIFSVSGNTETQILIEKSKGYLTSQTKLFDFACGTRQSTVLFSNIVNNATGLDYSDEMIKFASKKKKANIKFITGTLEHESLENCTYDVVVAFNVLHFIEILDVLASKIHDLLKPNGIFISNTQCLGEKKLIWVIAIIALNRLKLFPDIFPLTSKLLIERLIANGFVKEYGDITGGMVKNTFLVIRKGDVYEIQ